MNFDALLDLIQQNIHARPWALVALNVSALIAIAASAKWLVGHVVGRMGYRLLSLTGHANWAGALLHHRTSRRLGYAVFLAVIALCIGEVPHLGQFSVVIGRLAHAGTWISVFLMLTGVLNAWQTVFAGSHNAQTYSIKGYVQVAQLALWLICGVLVLSILIDRSPLWMLSGLGALSAVLLLVFKDTLLSLVASTQLTSNDMLRIGDWIEMPQSNADGFVMDIALHTVKVKNWDNTVTTVPTYKLFSESYRNYRHMFESGARRIKRTLRIDATSVRFLGDDEVKSLMRFRLLHDYLEVKRQEVEQSNRELLDPDTDPVNRRRLTNLGTFRAYGIAFLRAHPEIHHDLLLNLRMMESDSQGIPIEVYCFTTRTNWTDYERIQGDIFDHLFAILPELGLRVYQAPSGADLSGLRSSATPGAQHAALAMAAADSGMREPSVARTDRADRVA